MSQPAFTIQRHHQRTDQMMWMPAFAHLLLCLGVGLATGTLGIAVIFAVTAFPLAALVQWKLPGHVVNGFTKAALFMGLSMLLIEQSGGMIEAHFSIFIMLAVLILYSDWRVIAFGGLVIAIHHVLFTWLQYGGHVHLYQSIGSHGEEASLFACLLMHAGAVVAQVVVLGFLARELRRMVDDSLTVCEFAETASEGRLDMPFSATQLGRPAIAAIGNMQKKLTGTLRKARDAAKQVNSLGDGLFQAHDSVRSQASHNTAQVERVSAAATEMAATTRESAEKASLARHLASEAELAAKSGGAKVASLRDAMQLLEENARNISSLLGEIDNITFQTNLLALNASVEAARAGEHGRGFAVVASEVRTLAQRTSDTAGRIRERVQQTEAGVRSSVQQTQDVDQTMQQVMETFREVASRLAEIDHATSQQHLGIEDLDASVNEMQSSIQHSAHSLEDAHQLAEHLAQVATSLMTSINEFTFYESNTQLTTAKRDQPAGQAPSSASFHAPALVS
ncbi:methyl-accepting chemotaxis protein [Billgrantia montanilacus]|uniref:Methyl-accepting chemotaxis protein n=1 Tax=Billgrantia montanilacus TaxID=2282305 RepID=A0A368TZA2_9GAMM|nr:methyl-accepting chemotaxis protein [Halomonas montanilacus]RCV90115.1 methyl-accepting chemotaxis protein [Halomonas montanilacus]